MGPTGEPETIITNYQYTLSKTPEERRPLLRGWSKNLYGFLMLEIICEVWSGYLRRK
jgi:hypothetical protein